ncbi:unnamed protein product [Adineta steineri]|uniref:Uncharacterized protein n=1 Tax=Adineta steineri TaxID=433720 RepID=A0A819KZC2_9BILA|nr:unnamed protein product [Adineta steineri]CAF3952844.1 unnamed protein product [Adineta steineri]
MAHMNNSEKNQRNFDKFASVLKTKLDEARAKTPEEFSKPVHIVGAVDGSSECHLKQELQEEANNHTEERIVLMPYRLENFQWVGILIEFKTAQQIKRLEYIDSMTGFNVVPDKLKQALEEIYPRANLQIRDLKKDDNPKADDDPKTSALFIADNLVEAARNIQNVEDDASLVNQSQSKIMDDNHTNADLDEQERCDGVGNTQSYQISLGVILEEGSESKLEKSKLGVGEDLKKSNLIDANRLLGLEKRIQESVKQENREEARAKIEFEQKTLGNYKRSQSEESAILLLQILEDRLKKEEIFSEEISDILRDVDIYIKDADDQSTVRCLERLRGKIRFLNIPEIRRLVSKAEKAAELIRDKDVILLVGATGAGKSTTIQFLAGCQMKKVSVEVAPGNPLEHIQAVGTIRNSELRNVTSSPHNKSETRYIAPVTVQLKDIYGAHESGMITLCDAPGFGDTAGPEVDIANSVGVIEALKKRKT